MSSFKLPGSALSVLCSSNKTILVWHKSQTQWATYVYNVVLYQAITVTASYQ